MVFSITIANIGHQYWPYRQYQTQYRSILLGWYRICYLKTWYDIVIGQWLKSWLGLYKTPNTIKTLNK